METQNTSIKVRVNDFISLNLTLPKETDIMTFVGVSSMVEKLSNKISMMPLKKAYKAQNGKIFPLELVEKIKKLKNEGKTVMEIAKAVGRSYGQVDSKIRNMKHNGQW